MPFRIRLSMSATGSVIDIRELLPACLCNSGDVAPEGESPETDPAELKLAQIAPGTAAHLATVFLSRHELRGTRGLDDHCCSCHVFLYRCPNGIPSSRRRKRACSSFFAVVTMVMFMPFDLSTLATSISGKM